jgi:hypothetical protein
MKFLNSSSIVLINDEKKLFIVAFNQDYLLALQKVFYLEFLEYNPSDIAFNKIN